jgi:hypothetical protein
MSRQTKQMPRRAAFMAVWILIVHAVDVYWIVLPQFSSDGPHVSLSDIAAFLGVGGVVIAFAIFRMRGRYLVPVGDPFLQDSLEYLP